MHLEYINFKFSILVNYYLKLINKIKMSALNNHSRNTIDKNNTQRNSRTSVKKRFFIIEDNDVKAIEQRKNKLKVQIYFYNFRKIKKS